jgi:hypothetical protein
VFVQVDDLVGCLAPARVARFRHFAAACAATGSKLNAVYDRYLGAPEPPERERVGFERLGRESKNILATAITRLRAAGAGRSELSILAAHRAGLAVFVREVHRKAPGFEGRAGWIRLFLERDLPCHAPIPKGGG